jgi:ParB family chromosome partitioning protein
MALGRGLGELLGEVESAYENNIDNTDMIKEISVEDIKANPYQPRKIFDEQKIQELSNSILNHGLLQPIVVIKDKEFGYIVVAGERRLRATKLANIEYIKAIILDIDETKLREYALIENIHRSDLNILEIAYSYGSLINEHNITHDELASMVNKSRSSITNTLRLLTLSVYTQQMISANKITTGHAKLIIGLTEDEQKIIVDSIIGQRLSVRETEKLVKDLKSGTTVKKESLKNSSKYDFTPLDNIVKRLTNDKFKVKITKNSFNISITSQEDIENLLKYFNKS